MRLIGTKMIDIEEFRIQEEEQEEELKEETISVESSQRCNTHIHTQNK